MADLLLLQDFATGWWWGGAGPVGSLPVGPTGGGGGGAIFQCNVAQPHSAFHQSLCWRLCVQSIKFADLNFPLYLFVILIIHIGAKFELVSFVCLFVFFFQIIIQSVIVTLR